MAFRNMCILSNEHTVLVYFVFSCVAMTMVTVATTAEGIHTKSPARTLLTENGGKSSYFKSNAFHASQNKSGVDIDACFHYVPEFSGDPNSYYDTVVGCLNTLLENKLHFLNSVKYSKLNLFGSVVQLERTNVTYNTSSSAVNSRVPKELGEDSSDSRRSRNEEERFNNILATGLSRLARNYAMKVRIGEGMKLRVSRGISDALSVGIVFDEDDDDEDNDDDDDNEVDYDGEEDADEGEEDDNKPLGRQARAGEGVAPPAGANSGGGGGGISEGATGNKKKKKKKKNSTKKKDKEFKEKLPMLLIPFIIQAIILPLFLANLKMIAIKSIVVGKITLFLVLYNYLRRKTLRRREDDDMEHIAINHYGFNGDMEYGALVNGRGL